MESSLFILPDNYKLDDIDIFAYRGVVKKIPKYGDITIRQLYADEWFYVYLPAMTIMGKHFAHAFPDVSILDKLENAREDDIRDMFIRAFLRERMRISFIKALKKLKIVRGSIRKFLRSVTLGEIFEIFYLLYMFNTEGLKKKFTCLMKNHAIVRNMTSETSSSSAKSEIGSGKMKVVEKIDEAAWRMRLRS
jgi:hypothetical protein